jgi:toxin ParE1/3/4
MLKRSFVKVLRTQNRARFAPRGRLSRTSRRGMGYLVNLTARAERDLGDLYDEIYVEHSPAALRSYLGFKEAILTLEDHPKRCPLTPESDKFRHLLYGNKPHIYRAIFRVLEKRKRVEVLHIRHAARQRFKAPDAD